MSADQVAQDLGAEREIDLRSWLEALRSRWWIAVVGLVIGAVIGGLYSLSGASTYTATALIARGQAFTPGGNQPVLSYLSSPFTLEVLATSPVALKYAAAKAGVSPGELRGHVTASTINAPGEAQQNTNSTLIQIAVTLNRPKRAEDAANALAELIKRQTTSGYVRQSIGVYQVRLKNYAQRLKTLQTRINALNATLAKSSNLSALDQLVIASQLDSAEAAYGQTLDSQTTNGAAPHPGPAGRADPDHPAGARPEVDGALAAELGRRRRGDRAPDRPDRRRSSSGCAPRRAAAAPA